MESDGTDVAPLYFKDTVAEFDGHFGRSRRIPRTRGGRSRRRRRRRKRKDGTQGSARYDDVEVPVGVECFLVSEMHGKCIDIKAYSRENGAPLHLWEKHGDDNQLWILEQSQKGDGWYTMKSKMHGKYLTVGRNSNWLDWSYHLTSMQEYDGGTGQQFKPERGGFYKAHNGKDAVLDVEGEGLDNGTRLCGYTKKSGGHTKTAGQRWALQEPRFSALVVEVEREMIAQLDECARQSGHATNAVATANGAANAASMIPGLGVAADIAALIGLSVTIANIFDQSIDFEDLCKRLSNGDSARDKTKQNRKINKILKRIVTAINKLSKKLLKRMASKGMIMKLLKKFAGRTFIKEAMSWVPVVGNVISGSIAVHSTLGVGDDLIKEYRAIYLEGMYELLDTKDEAEELAYQGDELDDEEEAEILNELDGMAEDA